MALSIKNLLLQAFVIPGTVFCASTLPLAIFGSQQVVIEFQEEPIFAGQLREIASPYLAFATAVSIGVGCAGVAMTGWRQSHQKSSRVEEELSALRQALNDKETQLEDLKLTDSRLAASGLSSFLVDGTQESQAVTAQITEVTAQAKIPQTLNRQQSTATLAQSTNSLAVEVADSPESHTSPSRTNVKAQVVSHSASQSFLGFTYASKARTPETAVLVTSQIKELRSQLQQITAHLASLQHELQITPMGETDDSQNLTRDRAKFAFASGGADK